MLSVLHPVKFFSLLSAGPPEARGRLARTGLLILLISAFLSVVQTQFVNEVHRDLLYLGFLTPQENYWWGMLGVIPTALGVALLIKVFVFLLRKRISYGDAFISVSFPELAHVWAFVPLTLAVSVPRNLVAAYIIGSALALWTLYLSCVALSSFLRSSVKRAFLIVIIALMTFYMILGVGAVFLHTLVLNT